MTQQHISFSGTGTDFYFDASLKKLAELAPADKSFIITDENLALHYQDALKPWRCIVIAPGEESKSLAVLDDIIRQLIALEAGRDATIVGLGGGVVTDIAGFVAGIYKRGVRCGFVPTSLLAMVDASVGGKNGLDIDEYKNMMGLIRQPSFLLYDFSLLQSLPEEEWINGFAEIIKHACIADENMFAALEQSSLAAYRKDANLIAALVQQNALLKAGYVQEDEWEHGRRKELNFGHTLGHAIENIHALPHGHAVAIGMAFAAAISTELCHFKAKERVLALLKQYKLPVEISFDKDQVLHIMQADKKRNSSGLDYVLLESIGKACVQRLSLNDLKELL